MAARSKSLFERLGAAISPEARIADLRIGDQQMVEIAKALAFDAEIVIMDEPTSALSDSEVARLFRVIADLRKAGTTVLYISHKMNEVFTLTDRVTVLRDGQFVATAARAETSAAQVVRWMVGREIASLNYVQHPIGERRCSRSNVSRCPVRRGADDRACATSPLRCTPARSWASRGFWGLAGPSCSKPSSAPARSSRRARSASTEARFVSPIPTMRSRPGSPWSPKTARPWASSTA